MPEVLLEQKRMSTGLLFVGQELTGGTRARSGARGAQLKLDDRLLLLAQQQAARQKRSRKGASQTTAKENRVRLELSLK